MLYLYRIYDKERNFQRQIEAENYTKAVELLKPKEGETVWSVEEDGHEILCGMAWVNSLFENLPE